MPSYAEVVTQTFLPAQAAKLRWESAKTVAGEQFNALAEQRRAIEEVRYRRQQYADTVAASDSSTDAFAFQALQATINAKPKDPEDLRKAHAAAEKKFRDALADLKAQPEGEETFKSGSAGALDLENAKKAARNLEEWAEMVAVARSKKLADPLIPPATLKSREKAEAKVAKGVANAQAELDNMLLGQRELFDLADNMGSRAFQGGAKAREFYDSLTDDQQQLSRIYATALMGDGVVTEDEIPEGRFEEARKLHDEIARRGAYRRGERLAFDPIFLEMQKGLAADEARLKETEARLKGKTKETLAEELYTGATERAAIPPLLRSLEPEMKRYLDGFTAAQAADPKTDPESYLRSKMTAREAKGFSAASAMAASGMRAADIMDNLQALSPEERRSVMSALASRDAIVSTQMKVAPGTPLPEIEKIQTEDRRAQEAELARAETRLQRRLRQLDESLAVGRESGFGGIVSPDTGARRAPVDTRREVLMGALSPEEEATQARLSDEAEVERIAAERDRERDRTAAFKRTADADMLETPEEVAAVEEFRRRQAAQPGQLRLPAPAAQPGQLRLPAPAAPSTRLSPEERLRLEAVDAAARKAAFLQYGRAPDERSRELIRETMMRALTPTQSVGPTRADLRPEPFEFDQPEPVEVKPEPLPEPPPERIMKRVYNPATGEIELVEVK